MTKTVKTLMISVAGLTACSSACWAGVVMGAPAPIAGVGLPALAIGAVAFWLTRKFRKHSPTS